MKWDIFKKRDRPPLQETEEQNPPIPEKLTPQSRDNEERPTQKGEIMSEEMITRDNVSKDSLKAVFDAAFMDCEYDGDQLFVREGYIFYIDINEGAGMINIAISFGFRETAGEAQRFRCINDINASFVMVRAYIVEDKLVFSYDIPLAGGITKKAIVLLVKRFAQIIPECIQKSASGLLN